METSNKTTSPIDRARAALTAVGYSCHEQSPGPGIYIARMAPDADGSTEPGSAWDDECDSILALVREIVEPCGCTAEWSDDDIVIDAAAGGAR